MEEIRVATVEEAVQAAQELGNSDITYWFRGESKVRPLRSSFVRLNPEAQKNALEQLGRYESWLEDTPGLENLAANIDQAVAVAQHYGLPTNFLDFTASPEIAGFFASEKGGTDRAEEPACILCLDVEDLKEFWRGLTECFPDRFSPLEFLEMTVPDLWRLERQQGCFLFCPCDDIEKLYDFDRIVFPNTHTLHEVKREEVYPKRKSALESLLNQYFMNEGLIEWNNRPESIHFMSHFTRVISETPEDIDPEMFPDGLPEHTSWSVSSLQPWLELRAERFDDAKTELAFLIDIPDDPDIPSLAKSIADHLISDLSDHPKIRTKLVGWDVQLGGGHRFPEDFPSHLAAKLEVLWDGLRRLPYRDEDICAGIGMCVAFSVAIKGQFTTGDSDTWIQAAELGLIRPMELQFGPGDGSYSRGLASSASLSAAIRPDLGSYMVAEWKESLMADVSEILRASRNPRKTFDFNLLAPLFAREIAPYQVLARKTAIFYSPARLKSLIYVW